MACNEFERGAVQRLLLRDLMLVLLLVGGVSAALLYLFGRDNRQMVIEGLVGQSARSVGLQLGLTLTPLEQVLDVLRRWGEAGTLAKKSPAELHERLAPLLDQIPQVVGLQIAEADGAEFSLRRSGDGWLIRLTAAGGGKQRWQTAAGKQVPAPRVAAEGYDPRKRPWYQVAQKRPGASWSEPYAFWSTGELGVTAAVAWTADGRSQTGALDVSLSAMVDQLGDIESLPGGIVFLLDRENIAHPDPNLLEQNPELEQTLLRLAESWSAAGRPTDQVVRGDQDWWAGFHRAELSGRPAWIGLAVPDVAFETWISSRRSGRLAIFLLPLFLGAGLVWWLVRRHSERVPLGDVQVDAAMVQALIRRGEGRTVEFKSSMRMNLNSGKPGKEIELAWLKGVVAFLNTDGGSLLLGVADDGELLGLEVDNFQNEDRCRLHFKNLLQQHIGLEFSHYVNFFVINVDGKMIGLVRCNSSKEPVFLRQGKEEEFYIRSGPASVKLPGSQLLRYLENRKA